MKLISMITKSVGKIRRKRLRKYIINRLTTLWLDGWSGFVTPSSLLLLLDRHRERDEVTRGDPECFGF